MRHLASCATDNIIVLLAKEYFVELLESNKTKIYISFTLIQFQGDSEPQTYFHYKGRQTNLNIP